MATLVELDPSLALIDAFPAAPLVPRSDHEMVPQPAPIPPGHGSDDPVHDTKWIQASLNDLDPEAGLKVDGIWGRHTRRSLMDFQDLHGLEADGIAGPLTIAAIEEALQAEVT
jgi:peptidoglycan hydrolase-like protein with peptidoglycan-binding domain